MPVLILPPPPPPVPIVQTYVPPNYGGPKRTGGAGTR